MAGNLQAQLLHQPSLYSSTHQKNNDRNTITMKARRFIRNIALPDMPASSCIACAARVAAGKVVKTSAVLDAPIKQYAQKKYVQYSIFAPLYVL